METENLILKIQASYNQFTKAEKKVADYILNNQQNVLYMSITDLADACKVGDTSVYRFCRTMNLQGYQDFKMKLSLSLGAKNQIKKEMGISEKVTDQFLEIADEVKKIQIQAIEQTNLLLERERFFQILRTLKQARNVYFFGIGDSLLTAQEARNKFLRITKKVHCITDPHMQAMTASMMTKEDFIIMISYSGASKDNIHVAKIAKETGAKIACITHFHKSPLTMYTDMVLLCGSQEAPLDGGSMSVKISQLYIIDLLFQEYYIENYEECKKNNEFTSRAVVDKLL